MATARKLLGQLNKKIQSMPAASPDNKFVLWFLAAYTGEDPNSKTLRDAITGGTGDGGIDAVYINTNAKRVVLVQGKYGRNFSRRFLYDFTEVADNVWALVEDTDGTGGDKREQAEKWWGKLNGTVQKSLQNAFKYLESDYTLYLVFATIAHIPKSAEKQWMREARRDEVFEVFDQGSIVNLFQHYLDHRPYIGAVELPSVSEYFRTVENGIESFLLPVRGKDLADLYHREGEKLFALQVRGFLGSNEVNRDIRNTLRTNPKEFWFYNNGLTIVCDEAVPSRPEGIWKLLLKNPQIINGQQTVRMLSAEDAKNTGKATVLVRIYVASHESVDDYDRFVSNMVKATNFQNKVSMADLMSHHERMFDLETSFRQSVPDPWGSYLFLRKRGRVEIQGNPYKVKKEDLAQILQACSGDPALVRRGKEYLFGQRFGELFKPINSQRDVSKYLAQWWMHKAIQRVSKSKRAWGYARWHVLHFMWAQLSFGVKHQESFIQVMHWYNPRNPKGLESAIRQTFRVIMQFYRKNKKPKDTPSEFFRRANLYPQFQAFWKGAGRGQARTKFQRNIRKFKNSLQQ